MNQLINPATPLFTGSLENVDFSKIHEKFIKSSIEKQLDDLSVDNLPQDLRREAKSVR